MSVIATVGNGSIHNEDSEDQKWAFKVEANGVLTVLSFGADKTWTVSGEYGAASWTAVNGTRFLSDTGKLPGLNGLAKTAGSPVQGF